MAKDIITNCLNCNKEISLRAWQRRKGRGKYCSRQCKGMGWNISGQNNPNWNNGKTNHQSGYILVRAPEDHPYKDAHGYIREYRLVLEKSIGRYLIPTEDVHHINGIKTDNRIENLELVNSRSEHLVMEHSRGTYKDHLEKLNGGINRG